MRKRRFGCHPSLTGYTPCTACTRDLGAHGQGFLGADGQAFPGRIRQLFRAVAIGESSGLSPRLGAGCNAPLFDQLEGDSPKHHGSAFGCREMIRSKEKQSVMSGIDSRRAPKIFSLAALGDLLTRIHSDPHVVRSARPPKKQVTEKTRSLLAFRWLLHEFRGAKSLEGGTCV